MPVFDLLNWRFDHFSLFDLLQGWFCSSSLFVI
jgi:hypothetical protein